MQRFRTSITIGVARGTVPISLNGSQRVSVILGERRRYLPRRQCRLYVPDVCGYL